MNASLFLYLPLLFVGGVFSAVSGGGLGILTVILGSFFLDVRTNIAFTSVLMITIQIAKMMQFQSSIKWNVVLWYVLLGLPMSVIGGVLLFRIAPIIPQLLLGIFCLVFVAARFWRVMPTVQPSRVMLVLFGAVNGLVGGLIGNASLLRMPALVAMGMRKEVFISTSAVIAFIMNVGKASVYAWNLDWTDGLLQLFFLSIPVVFVSVWLGKKFLRFVSVELFEDLQLGIITLGALRLLLFP